MDDSKNARLEILQLLATGKISATEAAELLDSANRTDKGETNVHLSTSEPQTTAALKEEEIAKNSPSPSWLHVRVTDLKTGKGKVMVNVPLKLVRYGFNIGRRYAPELEDLDWDELAGTVYEDQGILVDVMDEEDGEHVQIYVD
jgi:hypothetical protein